MKIHDKYYLTDLESGKLYEVTKEYHDAYIALWKIMHSNLEKAVKGKVFIAGTAGEIDGNDEELRKMFHSPEYGIKPIDTKYES